MIWAESAGRARGMAELGSNVIGEYLHSLHAEGSFPVPRPRYQFWLGLSLPAMSAGWHLCDFFLKGGGGGCYCFLFSLAGKE